MPPVVRRISRIFSPERLFWFFLGVVVVLSLIPSPPPVPSPFPALDKVEHAGAYAFLAFLRWLGFRGRSGGRRFFLTLLFLILVGGALEVIQSFTGRSPEWWDLAADAGGAAAGLGVGIL